MLSVLGIDAAWTAGQPSGVALVAKGDTGVWRCLCIALPQSRRAGSVTMRSRASSACHRSRRPARFPGRRYARVGGDRLRQATKGSDNDASSCRPSGMRRCRRPHPVDVGGRVSAAACLA
jgi:hypothetical protein